VAIRKAGLVLALAVAVAGVYAARHHYRSRSVSLPNLPAPQLSLTDIDGRAVHTSDYNGRVLLVSFWAAWCLPCNEEVPHFVELQQKYQNQGLQTIGFSVDDARDDLRNFYQKFKMNYPVVPADQKTLSAYGGLPGLPTTLLIDRRGRIREKYVGYTDFNKLEQRIIALLRA